MEPPTDPSSQPEPYGKKNPFPAPLLVHERLCGEGSVKDIRHFEIGLQESGLEYQCGDSLAVIPQNDPEYVERLLQLIRCDGEEAVTTPKGEETSLRNALQKHFAITGISRKFLADFAERANDFYLRNLMQPEMKKDLAKYLEGREIIDLLLAHPKVTYTVEEFSSLLGKILPRLYSIASSLKKHPDEVHLTVARVEYVTEGITRKGVRSTYLSDRIALGDTMPVFVQTAKGFKPPQDNSAPMIMVGPGTGIAPFRAFLEEREADGASGKNWVFFGNPHSKTDYCYGEDFERWKANGLLTKLDLAWSRDQDHKIYVQHKLTENAAELWKWIDDGAYFYVCGDATYMAKDVDDALHALIRDQGGRSEEEAVEYVKQMKTDKRYQRDVY